MAASMFYGRQLAAAALRSHRPQTTLRAAAQVSPPCSLWPRGSAGKAQGARPSSGALRGAGTVGMPCSAQRLRARAASWRWGIWVLLRPPAAGGPAGRPGCRPRLREPAGAIPEETGPSLPGGHRFRAPFG